MIVEIVSIGDELVSGQTIDTNAAWLAEALSTIGVRCSRHVTIADDLAAIHAALKEGAKSADVVIATGGLGPTPDDLTRDALANALNSRLCLHAPSLERIEAYFRERRRRMHPRNRAQAMIPEGAAPIPNDRGTAPGLHATLQSAELFCLPGVPHEMKAMFDGFVLGKLSERSGKAIIKRRVLRTFGMSEAEIGEKLADLMARGRNPSVGTSADELVISVRIAARGADRDQATRLLDLDAAEIRARLGETVFGEEEATLAHAVGRLLTERKLTVATAESCTGGLLAKRLTDVPGASEYLREGFIVYSNQAKHARLGLPLKLIEDRGAVSEAVADAMAANCRRIAAVDYALSATGIAGPSGGSKTKPVGLVFIGMATESETTVKELRLGENLGRDQIRDRTVKIALNLLRLRLLRAGDSPNRRSGSHSSITGSESTIPNSPNKL